MVRVGSRSLEEDYSFVIVQSLQYGYEKLYNEKNRAFSNKRIAQPAHQILTEKLLYFIEKQIQLETKEKWYYFDLKALLQNLLINVHCADEYAHRLNKHLIKVNHLSHSIQ